MAEMAWNKMGGNAAPPWIANGLAGRITGGRG